jgi:threonine dehydrogenase-like Zn-dependent dehydrogenase
MRAISCRGGKLRPVRHAVTSSFDAVMEAVGKPEGWEVAVKLKRKGGAVNFFGDCPADTNISLDTNLLHYSNLRLLASFHHIPARSAGRCKSSKQAWCAPRISLAADGRWAASLNCFNPWPPVIAR